MLFASSNKNKAIDSIIRILEIPIALQLFSTLKHITPYIFVQALIYTKSTKDASVLLNISNRSIERGTKRLLGSRYLNYTSPLRNKLLNACNLQHCLQCDRIYPFTEEFFL